jgi:chemotaxis protein methyltransferase CheR
MLGTTADRIRIDDFRWLQGLLQERSSVVLEDSRKFLAEKRLGHLVMRLGVPGFRELFAELKRGLSAPLIDEVVDLLAGGETWFFRDVAAFNQLRREVLPRLVAARRAERRLRLWSAGCGSGQEAYSLAMLLDHEVPELAAWDVQLLATDLLPSQVQRAKEGLYSREEVNHGLPAAMLPDYFEQEDLDWRVRAHLRSRVDFRVLRLDRPWEAGLPPFDLVLLRNVLVYFDAATRLDVLRRMEGQLAPDGCLLLGCREHLDPGTGLKELAPQSDCYARTASAVGA